MIQGRSRSGGKTHMEVEKKSASPHMSYSVVGLASPPQVLFLTEVVRSAKYGFTTPGFIQGLRTQRSTRQ